MIKHIQPVLRKNVLSLAREYANVSGRKSLKSVSVLAHGDSSFFDKMASGEGSFTARKYDEVVAWFEKNWPDGSVMPKLIDPQHQQKEKRNGAKTKTIRTGRKKG